MRKVRTAIIGCGKVGRTHASALSTLEQSEFVAVCDVDVERAKAFASDYGVRGFDSVTGMLRQCEIEAVTICTPHPVHEQPCLEATRGGTHVLLEKPMASTVDACDRMIESAREHNVNLSTVSQRRWYEPVRRMRTAIDQGKIGKPILGTFTMLSWRDQAYYESDPWRGKWETEGGGVLINQAPHQLDLLQWFMGPIEEISGYWANLNHPYIEVEDTAIAMIRFRSGALGNVVASVSQKPGIHTKVHIHGSNGASVGVQTDSGASFVAGMTDVGEPPLNDLWTVPGEEQKLSEFERYDREAFTQIDVTNYYHRLQIADFLDAIIEDRLPTVGPDEGRTVVAMIEAIYRSNERKQPVRFS